MIYDGDDEIIRGICKKVEKYLKVSKSKGLLPTITKLHIVNNRVFIDMFPYSIEVDFSKEELDYIKTNPIRFMVNNKILGTRLGYKYLGKYYDNKSMANRVMYKEVNRINGVCIEI